MNKKTKDTTFLTERITNKQIYLLLLSVSGGQKEIIERQATHEKVDGLQFKFQWSAITLLFLIILFIAGKVFIQLG